MSSASLARIVERWTHPDFPPRRVQPGELAMVERAFSFTLPKSYKIEVLRTGLPHMGIWLLDTICDNKLDLRDVSSFFSPDEIVQETNDWHEIGLPKDLVAFASDCMGNLFAFSRHDQLESTVWFWDHDFNEVDEDAESFLAWLEAFCSIESHGDRV